jgi:hypothetical protein
MEETKDKEGYSTEMKMRRGIEQYESRKKSSGRRLKSRYD